MFYGIGYSIKVDLIKDYLKKNNISVAKFGVFCGLKSDSLYPILSKKVKMSHHIEKIAKAMGIKVEKLLKSDNLERDKNLDAVSFEYPDYYLEPCNYIEKY